EDISRQGIIPPIIGVWLPNLTITIFGLLMLTRYQWLKERSMVLIERGMPALKKIERVFQGENGKAAVNRVKFGFPRIIDRMILLDLLRNFLVVLVGISVVFLVFTLFELTNSIVENHVHATI